MSDVVALIDIGSNAARCIIARVFPGLGFEVLHQDRLQTRLGSGQGGVLPRGAVRETLAFVRRFLSMARKQYQPRVMAVATAAVREAVNRDDLLGTLEREEDVVVQVLSGEEEARLGALAALRSLSFRTGVVIDLGGGSLQLTHVHESSIATTASLPLGAVRTTRRFLSADPPTKQELTGLRREVQRLVAPKLPAVRNAPELVGLGGTVRALASMHLSALNGSRPSRQGFRLRRDDIDRLCRYLQELPLHDRRRLPGLAAERADIIVAGAVVVAEVMSIGGYDTLTVCKGGVRQGLLLRETFNERL
jgi:exopolyphosphatase/guanosine-5'-triphosphate,3'-diphosphate pyrophosphatase